MMEVLDLIGTAVFAISGATSGMQKQFDIFGVAIVGFVTAIGGGTIRDILIGQHPVSWMVDYQYVVVILLSIAIAVIFQRLVRRLRRTLFLFDAIGLGVFTISGIEKSIAHDLPLGIAITLGMITAVFGGVIRDILCNQVPLIFKREIYATSCLAGGVLYIALLRMDLSASFATYTSILLILIIRIVAVKKRLALPVIHYRA